MHVGSWKKLSTLASAHWADRAPLKPSENALHVETMPTTWQMQDVRPLHHVVQADGALLGCSGGNDRAVRDAPK